MSSIPETLRSKGLKVTPQRIAILNMLMNTKAHPTAEAIFKALEPTNPTMSLATVYKTLDSFTAADIIQEFHPHLICRKCGAVCDIDADISDEINSIIKKVSSESDCSIDREQLFFYGLCEGCK